MKKIFTIFLFFAFFSCGPSYERKAATAQGLLDDADIYMQIREFAKSYDTAVKATDMIANSLQAAPSNVDIKLLLARAYMTQFMAKNILIIENAAPLEKSFVTLPSVDQYKKFSQTIGKAKTILSDVINNETSLSFEQKGYAHAMLAACFRLQLSTAQDAVREYQASIEAYQSLLQELSMEKKQVGSNEIQITQLKEQIQSLWMSVSEVNFLLNNWNAALFSLQQAMAGEDLSFFEVQLPLLDRQIIQQQNIIDQDVRITTDPRVERLNAAIAKTRKGKLTIREEQAGKGSAKAHLIALKIEQNQMKNNLLYRIICYYRLGMIREYDEARQILRSLYPKLDAQIAALLV